jgi:DNA polymerase III delta prime subunit
MAFKLSIPFYAFRLRLHSELSLLAPLSDAQALRAGQPLSAVAQQYQQALQEEALNQGDYRILLEEYRQGHFYKDTIEVKFPAAADQLSFPAFSLEFDYYFNPQPRGWWGIVPALRLEAFAAEEQQLAGLLREAILLDFNRKKRLQAVQDIVSAIWFEHIDLKQQAIELTAYSRNELEAAQLAAPERLLPSLASLLAPEQPAAYGLDQQLAQAWSTLRSEFVRNILVVGPAGVGKTALIWELARQLKQQGAEARIWETTAATLIKELSSGIGWQENLARLCRELSGSQDLLFVRNLAELFEVGKYQGNAVSMAEFLGPFLSRGELNLISECTEEELAFIELQSPTYLSFFQKIHLQVPPDEAMEDIVMQKTSERARQHGRQLEAEAVREAIRLSRRFEPYSGLPGKPIRFLENLLLKPARPPGPVTRMEVIQQFCQQTGIPRFMIDPDIPMDVTKIKSAFNEQLFGQEAAVASVTDLLATVKAALTRIGKPIASLLFLGPTGVGKTELAKMLAELMFGHRNRLTRFDMSEFSSAYSVLRLTGDGQAAEGLLTSAVRREPFSVLLFDEIEKAHPQFFDLLLQILEGRLTDSQGKLANFCSTIIIMTSNIGAEKLKQNPIGWKTQVAASEVQQHFIAAAESFFQPELVNRIDKVIPFAPLDQDTVRFVTDREIRLVRQREGIRFRRMNLRIAEAVLDQLGQQGYDPKYGARHLQRAIREHLLIPLAKALNTEDIDDQLEVEAYWQDGQIHFDITSDPLGLELLLEEYARIQNADYASRLRREMERLSESHLYVLLLNELDFMERKRAQAHQQFWADLATADRYAHFQQSKLQADALHQDIQTLEMNFAASCLGTLTYLPSWEDQLRRWEERLAAFKLELCAQMAPENNQCHLAIYGAQPEGIAEFYANLLSAKGYHYTAYSVWFRERYYNEEVWLETTQGMTRQKRQAYIKQAFEGRAFIPPKPGDVLWGVEFAISGSCAYLYLAGEQGGHKWESQEDNPRIYLVQVQPAASETPVRLHRKEFYDKLPIRRTLTPLIFKDTSYKIKRECNKSALLGLLLEKLDERFAVQIDNELL